MNDAIFNNKLNLKNEIDYNNQLNYLNMLSINILKKNFKIKKVTTSYWERTLGTLMSCQKLAGFSRSEFE